MTPEKLDPDTIVLPARLVVDKIKMQRLEDDLDAAIAGLVDVWRQVRHLRETGVTPRKDD